jgi:hypothetical protein
MLEHLGHEFLRAVRRAFGRVLLGGFIGLLVGGLAAEAAGFALDGGWPPRQFVNIAAIAFAVVLGYAVAVTRALIEGVRGLVAAASQVDDVAKAAVDTGLNVVDAAVDAVDGPTRHGIR